ncbi:hypothetical protein ACLBXM_15185 [Xanthobacteraceae bacterium A53D]
MMRLGRIAAGLVIGSGMMGAGIHGAAAQTFQPASLTCQTTAMSIIGNFKKSGPVAHVSALPLSKVEIRVTIAPGKDGASARIVTIVNGAPQERAHPLTCKSGLVSGVDCTGQKPNAEEGGTERVAFSYSTETMQYLLVHQHYLDEVGNGSVLTYGGTCAKT